jgi:catechol 2,3-dioxygenase-like lactoylglutathione lyase family enzyme
MSRVQLALNVEDLDASIAFYTKLFRTQPAKVREGYANFAIADPPLKLVLIAGDGAPGSLNHLGVEVESTDIVMAEAARMQAEGAACDLQESTTCCYAV